MRGRANMYKERAPGNQETPMGVIVLARAHGGPVRGHGFVMKTHQAQKCEHRFP